MHEVEITEKSLVEPGDVDPHREIAHRRSPGGFLADDGADQRLSRPVRLRRICIFNFLWWESILFRVNIDVDEPLTRQTEKKVLHMAAALKFGTTVEEIIEVLELTCDLGV